MRRRALHAAVLAFLVVSGFAWVSLDKTVTVEVDGQPRVVRTYARTVAGVLRRIDTRVGEHDLVLPGPDVAVEDGARIVYRRGRPLILTINGERRTVWVTALSVDEALEQLGVREAALAFVSASRSGRIPLDGLALEVREPARVRILVDGRERAVTTTVATVGEALAQARVSLGRTDSIAPAPGTLPRDGMVVRVTRIAGGRYVETTGISYATERRNDATLYKGDNKVAVPGINGVRERVFAVRYVNKRLVEKKLVSARITRQPRTRVIRVGTKARPAFTGGSASTRSADGLNWHALAMCESGNNPRAVSPGGTYRGLYQFTLSTWRGVGGSGDPIDASRAEQTYRAKVLYTRRGSAPWGYCGQRLYS